MVYAGYGQSPSKWEKGTEPKPINWKAGLQYDGDVARAKEVLANLDTSTTPARRNTKSPGSSGGRAARTAATRPTSTVTSSTWSR